MLITNTKLETTQIPSCKTLNATSSFKLVIIKWASLMAQWVKNPSAMQEMRVRSHGLEDPLEEEMATLFSILAWKIPWTVEPGGPQSMGLQRVGHNRVTNTFTSNVI